MSGSVRKAFQIINLVAENQGNIRQVDIVNELRMTKATAHRYFDILEELNWLEKKDRNYYLGLGLFKLGNKVQNKNIIINRLEPILKSIVSEFNETINLAQLIGDQAIYLHKIESSRNLQFRAKPGDSIPLHCTAMGKSILSCLTKEHLDELLKNIKLKKYTNNTITSKVALKKQLKEINERGYAIESEEFEEGLICVSVPVNIPAYEFIGSISLSGTITRLNKNKLKLLADKIIPHIDRLKNDLSK